MLGLSLMVYGDTRVLSITECGLKLAHSFLLSGGITQLTCHSNPVTQRNMVIYCATH